MRNRLLIIVAFFVIVALVAALINGFVQDSIYPIVASAYVTIRSVITAFQSLVWLAIVFIGLNLAIQSLMAGKKRTPTVAVDTREFTGRIDTLAVWLRRIDHDEFFRWRIARHVTGMTREALGHSHTLSRQELEALLADPDSMPPQVANYLRMGLAVRSDKLEVKRFGERLWERFERFIPRHGGHFSAEPDLIKTIEFLEAELEVPSDRH